MRVRMHYQGRVQGVGFRATCRNIARALQVRGWVRNEADYSVTLEAQGQRSQIEAFLAQIRLRMDRNIERADSLEIAEFDGEADFEIRR